MLINPIVNKRLARTASTLLPCRASGFLVNRCSKSTVFTPEIYLTLTALSFFFLSRWFPSLQMSDSEKGSNGKPKELEDARREFELKKVPCCSISRIDRSCRNQED